MSKSARCGMAILFFASAIQPADSFADSQFGFGREATAEEIAAWDIDIRFDGVGLPSGNGSAEQGEIIYEAKCASCHGTFGEGEGRWPALVGGEDTLVGQGDVRPEKTVGSYWPYAPPLFDYIRRAMPYNAPQSLSDDEVYALIAYIFNLNGFVDDDFVADKKSLAAIEMPNRGNFVDDPRPDVHNKPCMRNCADENQLRLIESITGVTPLAHLSGDESGAASPTVAADSPGAAVYQRACIVCHLNGVGDAPLVGAEFAEQWRKRFADADGVDGLIKSVIAGKGLMPPRAGNSSLSDDEISAATQYILTSSGVEVH